MTYPTFGLLWRPVDTKGNCQLLTIPSSKDSFKWTHGKEDNSTSDVFKGPKTLDSAIDNALAEGAYWVGPMEMSGWGDD